MHLYVATRGVQDFVNRFWNDIAAQYVPYNEKVDEKGKPYMVRVAVRPIQLHEVVFPEDQLDEVLAMFGEKQYPGNKMINKWLDRIRKLLKLGPVPQTFKAASFRPIARTNVGIHLLGIKKDNKADGHEFL